MAFSKYNSYPEYMQEMTTESWNDFFHTALREWKAGRRTKAAFTKCTKIYVYSG